jgi:hypothetical protein
VEGKFLSPAAPLLGDAGARGVIREVESLDRRESLVEILAALKVSAA